MAATAPKSRKAESSGKTPPADKLHYDAGWRETVEAVAMAVVLALLFRAFVAEPFVIPTGSMAPTLMGRHKDVVCPECGYRYQANASSEINRDNNRTDVSVSQTTCPNCQFFLDLDEKEYPNDGSFSGDRIIVSKFAYDLAEPRRWDVIVFKFPGDAVQNYIKRLVGLPGETLKIVGGNVYTKKGSEPFRIARKPPHKLDTLLQLVHDNDYQEREFLDTVWPPRWRPVPKESADAWKTEKDRTAFTGTAPKDETIWLRYWHVLANRQDWDKLNGEPPLVPRGISERPGELITDFYSYNAYGNNFGIPPQVVPHWVDDLALDVTCQVQQPQGAVLLDLVRGGVHQTCRIDLTSGVATLSRRDADGKELPYATDDGKEELHPKAQTSVKGKGTYRLRLSNVDHEVLLWVNGSVVKFDGPTTYASDFLIRPTTSVEDGGDLQPAGVGLEGTTARLTHLRVLRDKYYIADRHGNDDYEASPYHSYTSVRAIFQDPAVWMTSSIFGDRREIEFVLGEDQFFPMGDNSPQSQDARSWSFNDRNLTDAPPYVERDLLIGKAVVIYWPHTWNRPIPFLPNFRRMGFIR